MQTKDDLWKVDRALQDLKAQMLEVREEMQYVIQRQVCPAPPAGAGGNPLPPPERPRRHRPPHGMFEIMAPVASLDDGLRVDWLLPFRYLWFPMLVSRSAFMFKSLHKHLQEGPNRVSLFFWPQQF